MLPIIGLWHFYCLDNNETDKQIDKCMEWRHYILSGSLQIRFVKNKLCNCNIQFLYYNMEMTPPGWNFTNIKQENWYWRRSAWLANNQENSPRWTKPNIQDRSHQTVTDFWSHSSSWWSGKPGIAFCQTWHGTKRVASYYFYNFNDTSLATVCYNVQSMKRQETNFVGIWNCIEKEGV